MIGGARAGKSTLALELAQSAGRPVTFLATAEAGDDEMAVRIDAHRRERPSDWDTLEEPLELRAGLESVDPTRTVGVDCLTLGVANALGRGDTPDAVLDEARATGDAAARRDGDAVVVTNEVGLGIVPANALARTFRDTLGAVNQAFADRAERTLLVVAGRVLELD